MTTLKNNVVDADISIENKLRMLWELQNVDKEINKIKTLRGELPLEVQDLEDELEGLDTRLNNLEEEVKNLKNQVTAKKNDIINSQALIKKYEEQQNNVRNNREFDSLSKEIEFQKLEIELSEKRIREFTAEMTIKKDQIDKSKITCDERKSDLEQKQTELQNIISETQKEEEMLEQKALDLEAKIEPRLVTAYNRIRKNARNGLAVVCVERDACGGCFNKIPPQRQLDIRSRKKIIVCEYCGRILVDAELTA